MVWSLETEDFNNIGNRGSYPLIKSVQSVFNGGKPVTPNPNTPSPGTGNPDPVTKPTPKPNTTCTKEGTMPHPTDCTKYITCIKSGRDNKFQSVVNSCPGGLAFDDNLKACNWMDAVESCY